MWNTNRIINPDKYHTRNTYNNDFISLDLHRDNQIIFPQPPLLVLPGTTNMALDFSEMFVDIIILLITYLCASI